jgi:sporulation protein YlmC with PRC-barrel domain
MRKMVYYFGAGLLMFSLVVAGNLSAQMGEQKATGYFQPATMSWETFQASDLIGVQLHTREMDVLGQINDLVIDPATKRISRIMVSDIPGMGGESVALPFGSLVKTGNNIFTYADPENVNYFYGEKPYWSVGFYWAADVDYVVPYIQPMPAGAEKTSQLIGASVETAKGEDVARINELVVDSKNGHVVYVVLSDVAGTEERLVAVPFDALSEPRGNVFVLNVTKDKLLAAPDFMWPDVTNRKYAEDIYRYYGLQPYWETE